MTNPTGLKKGYVEWVPHGNKGDAFIGRIVMPYSDGSRVSKTRRFAHINIFPWNVKKRGNVFLHYQDYKQNHDELWFDTIDEAKLHAEAVFALAD